MSNCFSFKDKTKQRTPFLNCLFAVAQFLKFSGFNIAYVDKNESHLEIP